MMFRVNGVDPAAAGEAWKTIPALMEAAERRGAKFPRKGAIVRPQKNPIEWRVNVTQMKTAGRQRDRRHRRRRTVARARSKAAARSLAFFDFLQARGAGLRQRLHRRHAAAARHPRDAPHHRPLPAQPATTCSAARASPTPSASTAGRSRTHVAGDVEWRWPTIPAVARLQPPALPDAAAAEGAATCWSPAAAPR